jgi:hypothetical protein
MVVVEGDTMMEFTEAPVDHEKEVAPDTVSVAVCPLQMEAEFTTSTGTGFTVTSAKAVSAQPDVVPLTLYEVVVKGEMLIEFVIPPVDHEYVEAPVAESVATCPVQMVAALTLTLGEGSTLTVAVAEEEQPAEVPVTVYVVPTAGVTTMEFARSPVDQE